MPKKKKTTTEGRETYSGFGFNKKERQRAHKALAVAKDQERQRMASGEHYVRIDGKTLILSKR